MNSQNTQETPIYRKLRDARRRAGLTQAQLAEKAGCKQSAVSMMEGGRMEALARPTVEKIAELLGVELQASLPETECVVHVHSGAKVCPNPDCPSNFPYAVGDEIYFLPHRHQVSGTHCGYCGEVLISECPECGAPVTAFAACCVQCGKPLVSVPVETPDNLRAWVANRQHLAQTLAAQVGGA